MILFDERLKPFPQRSLECFLGQVARSVEHDRKAAQPVRIITPPLRPLEEVPMNLAVDRSRARHRLYVERSRDVRGRVTLSERKHVEVTRHPRNGAESRAILPQRLN